MWKGLKKYKVDFNNIIGQKVVINSLIKNIQHDRIAHAYVFCGPEGAGKKTTARIFANILLCEKRDVSSKSCGNCMSCRMFEDRSNPDYHEIVAKGSTIGIDDIRHVRNDIIIKPLYSNKKVYLIIDAHDMTTQAQNSLLKTLEEPPDYAVFILTTSNYSALIETIRSRVLKYIFKKNTYTEIYRLLETETDINNKDMDFIVSYADGVIGTALKLTHSEEFSQIRDKTFEILSNTAKSGLKYIFDVYGFFDGNRENIDMILDIMVMFYRDMLVVKKSPNENILINTDKKDIIFSNASCFSTQKIIQSIEIIELTRKSIKQNANFQLSIEVMLMKLQEE